MVTDPSGASHRFAALDALRWIAALGVALHHIVAVNGPASWSLFGNGGLFVDFFFVLSVFVIAASYSERLAQGFSLARYAVLRIGRVWPLHVTMVLAALALELAAWFFGSQGLSAHAPFSGTHSRDMRSLRSCCSTAIFRAGPISTAVQAGRSRSSCCSTHWLHWPFAAGGGA